MVLHFFCIFLTTKLNLNYSLSAKSLKQSLGLFVFACVTNGQGRFQNTVRYQSGFSPKIVNDFQWFFYKNISISTNTATRFWCIEHMSMWQELFHFIICFHGVGSEKSLLWKLKVSISKTYRLELALIKLKENLDPIIKPFLVASKFLES